MSWFSIGKRILKLLPEFLLGTGAEAVGTGMRSAGKGASIWTRIKAGGKALETDIAKKSVNGGFFKRNWIELKSLPKDICTGSKVGAKGICKALAKRLPCIGALLTVIIEAPNIIKAFKNGGTKAGLKELGGTGVELGCMAAGAAIGTAVGGPIGTVIGGVVGGIVGMIIRGKTYSEKQKEKQSNTAVKQEEQAIKQLKDMGYSEKEINEAVKSGYSPIAMVEALNQIQQEEQLQLSQTTPQQQYTSSKKSRAKYTDEQYNPYQNSPNNSMMAQMQISQLSQNAGNYENDIMYKRHFGNPSASIFDTYDSQYPFKQNYAA